MSIEDALQEDGLRLTLTTDRSTYAVRAPISMTLRVENGSEEPITFEFTSAQRYDFVVTNSNGNEVWRWSDGRMFTMALGAETVEPGDVLAYTETIDGGIAEPGRYRIEGVLTARDRRASASLVIRVE